MWCTLTFSTHKKIKVSDLLNCSADVRAMMDAYLLDMFGTHLSMIRVNIGGVPTVYVSPRGAEVLRAKGLEVHG